MLAHERLKAWELCHELVLSLYRASEHWPKEERYGITSQIRSAAVSTASNIAEGAAKHGPKEFRRYLNISLGSLAETSYLLRLARDLGILTPDAWRDLDDLQRRAGGLTWRLARSLTGGTK